MRDEYENRIRTCCCRLSAVAAIAAGSLFDGQGFQLRVCLTVSLAFQRA